jgi:hypothetical protein
MRVINPFVKIRQPKVSVRINKNIPLGYTWATRENLILTQNYIYYGFKFLKNS